MALLSFAAPSPFNGDALVSELRAVGIPVTDRGVYLSGTNVMVNTTATTAQVQTVISAHTGQPLPLTTTEANRKTLSDRATAAIQTNNDFLALASPTNAQTLAQVKVLTRECSALIRLLLNQLDATD